MHTIVSKCTDDPALNDSFVNEFIANKYNVDLQVYDGEYMVLQIAKDIYRPI